MRVEMTAKEFSEYTQYLKHKQGKAHDPNWLVLRKEITDYCRSHSTMRRSFATPILIVILIVMWILVKNY